MRNNLKRAVSLLLAVVMVLGVLPVMAFAADTFVATAATGIPEGKDIVIYNALGSSVFGAVNAGNVSASFVNKTDDKLEVSEGAGAYRLTKDTDGTYYLTYGTKYLYAVDTSSLAFADSPVKGSKWTVKATTGGYYIASAEIMYGKNPVHIEYYGSAFKLWSYKADTNDNYVMNFYELPAEADDDHDGRIGADALPAGALPKDGSKVVVYNHNGESCIGAVDGVSLSAIYSEYSEEDGILAPGNGALIFTVHTDGKYYTFENDGKFLRTSDNNSDGTNAEELFFVAEQSDYTKWTLEEVEGGYLMANKIATYKNKPVVLEYFGESFKGWTTGSGSIDLYAMKFFEVEDEKNIGYVLNPTMTINAQNAYLGIPYEFKMKLDELSEVMSVEMTASVDGGAPFALTAKSIENNEYVYAVDGSKLKGSKLTLKGTAKNEYDMVYSAEVVVDIVDAPVILSVSPATNESTGTNKTPEIVANIANCGKNPTVVMKVNDEAVKTTVTDSKISYKPTAPMADGRYTVYLSVTRADGKFAEMTWSFTVGEDTLGLYYGQMHSHTAEYSDGAGTLEDAYEYASKAKDIDYIFVTDHSNYFDTTKTATTSSYYDLSSLEMAKSGGITKWEEAKLTALKYTTESFIAAYGYEMTWSGGPGHTNSFNTYGTVSRNNAEINNKTGYAGMHRYNDLMAYANQGLDINGAPVAEGVKTKYIEDAPVVSQFNHPGKTFGNFDNFAGYTPARDSVLSLVEVGNGEGAVGGNAYFPSYGEYDLALSKGWHVAPTINQDNHKGKWGDANTARDVIVTEDFTEAGLYHAMSERRVYATEDQNLRIYYYLNDVLMGGVVPVESDETIEKVTIKASISDPDKEGLGKIEVIGENGLSKYSVDVAGATYELKIDLNNTDAYYYLRITQADGDIAVTAPVWVGEATPITASVDTASYVHQWNVPETLTAIVTNSADAEYVVNKVEWALTVNGETTVRYTDTEAKTVASGATLTVTYDYAPVEIEGNHTIQVTFYGTYRGKDFKCMAQVLLKGVIDPDKLVKVGVDYSHHNYYLSGNYKDNAGNFVNFCAQNGVLADEIQAGEFTLENFEKNEYDLLVLTVPYLRKDGKANTYTAEELAILKTFVDNGGSLIVCSKSDRENDYDNCADNSNAILEAVGAHTRVVNGIIVDNEMKANEAYRIYFSSKSNFNTEHPFTAGSYTSSNAFNTLSSPENQTGFQVYNGAPIEILEGSEGKVETLIRGYSTTWGSHYDGYFTGSSFVPEYDEADESKVTVKMGDVNVMTYEDMGKDNFIVTSGVTFFSNYDIKDDVDYANKFILRNIMRTMAEKKNGAEVVTPISEVKKQSEGEFSVDGYITSNASAYDQDTAFFDCIYIQDKEGNGLNIFPVAGNYCIGMNVRCHGGITYYCGEVELNLSTDYNGSIRIISDEMYEVEPARVTCKEAMSDATIGNLMKVGGKVVDLHYTEGIVDKIYVQDATGIACVFINGYINKVYSGLDTLSIGDMIYATGIGSRDVDENAADGAVFARLRVRTRDEIIIVEEGCEHTWDAGKTTAATCGKDGKIVYTCTKADCGMTKTEVIPATGNHSYANGACTVCGKEDPNKPVEIPFKDVAENAWYYEAIAYTFENNLLNGVGSTKFGPETTVNRAMVATVLYRLAGEPTVNGTANFKDVDDNTWYGKAVAWAAEKGIVTGYSDKTFKPTKTISRQEMATMLARFAKLVGIDTAEGADLSSYPDAGSVHAWAKESVAWCVDNGIITGVKVSGKLNLKPLGDTTRAQLATIVMRYHKLVNG